MPTLQTPLNASSSAHPPPLGQQGGAADSRSAAAADGASLVVQPRGGDRGVFPGSCRVTACVPP